MSSQVAVSGSAWISFTASFLAALMREDRANKKRKSRSTRRGTANSFQAEFGNPGLRSVLLAQLLGVVRVELLHAFGTDAVAEVGPRVVVDVGLHLVPVAGVVADLLAGGANG